MEYIKKILSKSTDWLLLGVVICLTVLVFYNRTVEHVTNTNDDDEPTTPSTSELPSIPRVNVQVNELPVSQEALRHAIGEVYRADISAIKNLSDIARALQQGNGIQIPGKLVVKGETDLVGSVKKLKVDGETNLNKLIVDGDTNLKNTLTVTGDTSLNSKLKVTGETNIDTLTPSTDVVQYVGTDAKKNLISVQNPASLICYSIIGGANQTLVPAGSTPTRLSILGNTIISKGITLSDSKLKVSLPPNIKITCQIIYTCSARLDDTSNNYLYLYHNGNNINQFAYASVGGAEVINGTTNKTNPTAVTIMELKNGDTIEFYGKTESTKYGRTFEFSGLSISIIGLFY